MLFVVLVAEAFVVEEVFADSVAVFDLVEDADLVAVDVVLVVFVPVAGVDLAVEVSDLVDVVVRVVVCCLVVVVFDLVVAYFLVEVSDQVFALVDVVGFGASVPAFVVACYLGLVFVHAVLCLD